MLIHLIFTFHLFIPIINIMLNRIKDINPTITMYFKKNNLFLINL